MAIQTESSSEKSKASEKNPKKSGNTIKGLETRGGEPVASISFLCGLRKYFDPNDNKITCQ